MQSSMSMWILACGCSQDDHIFTVKKKKKKDYIWFYVTKLKLKLLFICLSDWKMVLILCPSIYSIILLIGAINWMFSVGRGRSLLQGMQVVFQPSVGSGRRGQRHRGCLCMRGPVGGECGPRCRSIASPPGDRSQQINQWHRISDWLKCHQLHN